MSRLRLAVDRIYAALFPQPGEKLVDPPFSTDFIVNDEEAHLQPLYFVTHPDGDFSVANPQPVLNPREERVNFHELEVQRFENEQRKWLLSIAPMIEVPAGEREFVCRGRSPFGYIHPKTFAKQNPAGKKTFTKWIVTSLMPEDRVIFSPFPLPGTEKRYGK